MKRIDTLEMFLRNNAKSKTVVRGFGRTWEQPLENIIPKEVDLMADRENAGMAADDTAEPTGAPVKSIELSGKTQKDKITEITGRMEQGIKDIFNSEQYKEYLSAMSKFHRYSFRNSLLIFLQKPDASLAKVLNCDTICTPFSSNR